MDILQNIKEFFSRYFPLHLNATVVALEDDLSDAELELYFSKARERVLREDLHNLTEANNSFRRDNAYLNSCLENVRQYIREVQHELDEVYSSMTPKMSSWPMPVSAHLEDTPFARSYIRVELPALRLSCMVNEAVRRGMYQGYLDEFSDSIARTAHKEVKEAVLDFLKNTLPIK